MRLLIFVFCLFPALASAEEWDSSKTEVDVELFLAVDVSRSMTARELEIQRRGYAEAILSDPVMTAVQEGALGRIAVTFVEWAGEYSQRIIVDWTTIETREDAEAFASALTAEFNSALRRTSISGILLYAAESMEDNSFYGLRRVIDVSGDGPNNNGRPVLRARSAVLDKGIVINGLPLMTNEGMGSRWHLDDLDVYYRECVIGGPGSFVLPVLEWEEFAAAVRRKLVLEIGNLVPIEPPRVRQAQGYDCLIGEKIWERNRQDWWEP